MSPPVFSANYQEARSHFLEVANQCGAAIHSRVHPLTGAKRETLAMDVAVQGRSDASRVLMTTSAVHGVEGFCGSAIQSGLLQQLILPEDVAVVHVHAVNPYGFSHERRVNEDNVDLNRNFINFGQPLPHNADYAQIHAQLLPSHWPPTPEQNALLETQSKIWGDRRMQRAITSGQYQFSEGVWFGGLKPTWSHTSFRHVLKNHLSHAKQIAWIDLHTGLGPSGHGERIFACTDNGVTLQRARQWWGQGITSIYDGSSSSAFLTGLMWMSVIEECPHAEYTGIALEYGTLPINDMLMALRADHWLHIHPEASDELKQSIKAQIFAAFYTDTDVWREQIISQAREAMFQAVEGLK